MRRMRKTAQIVLTWLACTALPLLAPTVAFAQAVEGGGVGEKSASVMGYFITGLGIVLGIIVVARPTSRENPSGGNTGPA